MSPRKAPLPTQLGNHIIRRRKLKGWDTAQLARAAELPYSTVRNVEKGYSRKPDEVILRALIKALECDEGVVFAYAGYGNIPNYTPEELTVRLNELGEEAPRWIEAIEGIKHEMTPAEQNQAYAVLKAQLDAARSRRRQGHR
jgi:transcriptional regulator with XRE-family HTH domain